MGYVDKTTEIHTHLRTKTIQNIKSFFDELYLLRNSAAYLSKL